ncbi:MAG: hypothetical protein PHR52_08950 [Fermentimonas sp.]|nr:hypothetical protein [Fermentimonas sp.]
MEKTKDDDNKYKRIGIKILAAPMLIVLVPFRLLITTSPIMIAIIAYFGYSFAIPLLFAFVLEAYGVKEEVTRFMCYFAAPIIAVAFHGFISRSLINNLQTILKGFGEKNKKVSVEIIQYLLNVDNIRFLIYLSYFIFLLVFSIKSINSALQEELTDFVILQAFLVFLAFDNIKINSKYVKFSPSKLLEQVKQIIMGSNDDINLEDNQ